MRRLLLCVLLGCSVDHTGLGPADSSPSRDARANDLDARNSPDARANDLDASRCDCDASRCDEVCWVPESCLELLKRDATLRTGAYTIDPDGDREGASFLVWCDMDFDGGGWTLVASSNALGPRSSAEGEVMPNAARHLPRRDLGPLAQSATQVHIRTAGMADTRSVTSTASTPIENLRGLKMLEVEEGGPSASWTGPMTSNLAYRCTPADETYPNIFHACGNGVGLYWFRGSTRWVNTQPNEALELYVR